MNEVDDTLQYHNQPVFLEETKEILSWMQTLSLEEMKQLWGCSDKIAKENYDRILHMDFTSRLTPALLSYEGIQYLYMAPAVFEQKMLDYVQKHLRILSGFYGVLKPMDGVRPYRLELESKTSIPNTKNLYDFWGRKVYDEIIDDSHIVINLASKQYAKLVETYKQPNDIFISCTFGEIKENRVVQKGTYAKMARGEMVHLMAKHNVTSLNDLKKMKPLGYVYSKKYSSDTNYVYLDSRKEKTKSDV